MITEKLKGIGKEVRESLRTSGSNYLLLIAIDNYQEFPKLNNCVRDAEGVMEVLFERYHFQKETTILLFNEKATRQNILDTLKDLKTRIKRNDNLVIYFSGHGEKDEEMGFLVPSDGFYSSNSNFISADDLNGRLSAIKSLHTLLILDACFSGFIFTQYKGISLTKGKGVEKRPSRWGLSACHGREPAAEGSPGSHSPFAEALIYHLKATKKSISAMDLGTKLIDDVTKATDYKQTPICQPLLVKGHDFGIFVFGLQQEQEEVHFPEESTPTAPNYNYRFDLFRERNIFIAKNATLLIVGWGTTVLTVGVCSPLISGNAIWSILGIISGFMTGIVAKRFYSQIQWRHVGLITMGWFFSFTLIYQYVNMGNNALSWALACAYGGTNLGLVMKAVKVIPYWKNVFIILISWAMGGMIGSAIGNIIIQEMSLLLGSLTIGLTIGFIGAIGMFWQSYKADPLLMNDANSY